MNQNDKLLMKRVFGFALFKVVLYMGVRKLAKNLRNG